MVYGSSGGQKFWLATSGETFRTLNACRSTGMLCCEEITATQNLNGHTSVAASFSKEVVVVECTASQGPSIPRDMFHRATAKEAAGTHERTATEQHRSRIKGMPLRKWFGGLQYEVSPHGVFKHPKPSVEASSGKFWRWQLLGCSA